MTLRRLAAARLHCTSPYLPLTHTHTPCTLMVATPTVLPRPPLFPTLMPRPQQPYPTPLAIPGRRVGKLIMRRDLVQEMDDLSDEEAELEDTVRQTSCYRVLFTDGDVKQTLEIKNRGYGFLVPIGKVLTQHEEKNDVRTLRRRRVASSLSELFEPCSSHHLGRRRIRCGRICALVAPRVTDRRG